MRRAAILLFALVVAGCRKSEAPRTASQGAAKSAPVTATVPPTQVGDVMPAYSAQTLDGKPFALSSEKGKVVFVNLWATWCTPCRMEIPELEKLQARYSSRGFEVIGVSLDEGAAADVKKFIDEEKITYPVVHDPEGNLANVLQTTVLPTSCIVDRAGKIVWRQVGALTPNEVAAVQSVIEKALAAKS